MLLFVATAYQTIEILLSGFFLTRCGGHTSKGIYTFSCMATDKLPKTNFMATPPQSIEDYFKSRIEQIDPEQVMVLKTPDPSSVVPGYRRYLSADHIKWLLSNILINAT